MYQLEMTTRDAGGRIYLAKDATMSAEGFAEMYPRLERFQSVLAEYDPTGRFESDMSRRLKIRTKRANERRIKTWLILGGSSSVARAFARQAPRQARKFC